MTRSMTDESSSLPPDAWREAVRLLDTSGQDADLAATLRADECFAAGDLDGSAWWRLVLRAIDILHRATPLPGDAHA